MKKQCLPSFFALLALWLVSTAALATVYTFSGTPSGGNTTYPACSNGGWSQSGATYSCNGSITLASGDSIVAAASITVVANGGVTLTGNNTIGSSASNVVNLQTTYGDIKASSTIYGNLTSSSGAITLTNSAVTGSLTTNGIVALSGGSVSGDVTSANGVTTTNGTVIGGNVTATNGPVSLSGGSVTGSVKSNCCTVTTNNTNVGNGVSSNSSTVSITGGTISGAISTSGGSGINIQNATVTASSISAGGNPIKITGSTVTVSGAISSTGGEGVVIASSTVGASSISAGGNPVKISDSTVSGAISGGGNGVAITNSTIPSGSISSAQPIQISNSTIGSASSPVNVTSTNTVTLTNSTVVNGQVAAATWPGALTIDSSSTVNGSCTPANPRCNAAVAGPDHIRVFFNNNTTALTCAPRAVDAIACANAACSARYSSSVSATLSPGGAAATIPVGGTGLPTVARTSAGSANVILASSNPLTVGAPALRCYSGTLATPGNDVTGACALTFTSAGLLVSVPDHASCDIQTLTVTAAKTDDQTNKCVPAFANGTSRDIKLRFAYVNPASGSTIPTVGSPPLSALATTGDLTLAMSFSGGSATTSLRYGDAGSLTVLASYAGSAATGDAGLSMASIAGSAFVVAPASFAISGIPAAPLTAGMPFNITLTANNSCGGVTANFGKETTPATALLTSSNPAPGLGNATAISQTLLGFSGGKASADLNWNEVGTVDITAKTTAYLASSLNVTGSQAAVGRFKPAYFETVVTPGCSGVFTYAGLTSSPAIAGQAFAVQVKAKRSGGDTTDSTNTANYAGTTWAKVVTLSDANGGPGTLANSTLAATDFSVGMARRSDTNYAMVNKHAAPYTLAIRATDADSVSSSGHIEGSTVMRSGRLRLGNAYGTERLDLAIPVQAQYSNGTVFVQNSDDSCTMLAASNIAPAGYHGGLNAGNMGASHLSVTPMVAGAARILVGKPDPVARGSVDLVLNLGSVGSPANCSSLSTTGSTSLAQPFLSGKWCDNNYDRDPVAHATFGVYKTPVIYRRESYR